MPIEKHFMKHREILSPGTIFVSKNTLVFTFVISTQFDNVNMSYTFMNHEGLSVTSFVPFTTWLKRGYYEVIAK